MVVVEISKVILFEQKCLTSWQPLTILLGSWQSRNSVSCQNGVHGSRPGLEAGHVSYDKCIKDICV